MHLRSLKRQVVEVRWAGFQAIFAAGETIWTESSHKYSLPELTALATSAGFRLEAQWLDQAWPFTENLLLAV
jgi:uncharacterized SAM-dependent methyltransferase